VPGESRKLSERAAQGHRPRSPRKSTHLATQGYSGFRVFPLRTRVRFPPPPLFGAERPRPPWLAAASPPHGPRARPRCPKRRVVCGARDRRCRRAYAGGRRPPRRQSSRRRLLWRWNSRRTFRLSGWTSHLDLRARSEALLEGLDPIRIRLLKHQVKRAPLPRKHLGQESEHVSRCYFVDPPQRCSSRDLSTVRIWSSTICPALLRNLMPTRVG
jgi:hypothetical protein